MRYSLSRRPAGTVLGPPAEKVSVPGRGDPSWAVGSTASARAAEHQNGRRATSADVLGALTRRPSPPALPA